MSEGGGVPAWESIETLAFSRAMWASTSRELFAYNLLFSSKNMALRGFTKSPLYRTISFQSRVLPPNAVWMEDSKLKSLEICHPQVL